MTGLGAGDPDGYPLAALRPAHWVTLGSLNEIKARLWDFDLGPCAVRAWPRDRNPAVSMEIDNQAPGTSTGVDLNDVA